MAGKRLKKHRITGAVLLVLFALYWCGITLFTHSHVVNGVIVVHSHPYNVEHSHTPAQLETVFFLSLLQASGDLSEAGELPFWLIPLGVIVFAGASAVSVRPARNILTRGPPCLRFSIH